MSMHALLDAAIASWKAAQATPAGLVGLCAALIAAVLVVVSSFVRTMIPLRWLAVGGNLGFLLYGVLQPSLVLVLLHGMLLPINGFRAAQMVRLTRRVRAAAAAEDLSGVWLRPYMRSSRLKAGTVLFHKGDHADYLYLLAEGRIEMVEIGEFIEPGRLFGEIAFFAPDKQRTLTARCAADCTVLSIDGYTFHQLYFQNPAFGLQVVTLLAGRLIADIQRLQRQLPQHDRLDEVGVVI